MSVNYYKTDFGIFTVIADTEVLTRVRAMSGYDYIIEKGVITSFGETVLDTFPELSEVIATIGVVENITGSEAYINMLTFIPQIRFFVLSDITTEAQTKIYTLSGLKNVQYTYRMTGTHSFLTTSELGYGTDKFRTATGYLPYGYGDTGQSVNACSIEFLIANDEMNDFMYYRIYINTIRDGEGSAAHINITGDELSFLVNYFDGLTPYDLDPYSGGGTSGEGGGTGDFDGTSDDIPIPDLPTLSATSANFITLFNPSLGELQNLANYMWSGFDLDSFRKLFANPMDCILGLSIVPVAVPDGGSKAVTVGNISTGITMNVAASQYVTVDCGTLNVNEYWGAYLDYDPYTKAEIYLPYIGTHPIAVDDIMNKSVHVVYHVDILSGACNAYVQCGGSVLYTFIGQCSASIPITGNDWTNVINGVLSIAGSIGSMVATGGMTAPMQAAQKIGTTAAKIGAGASIGTNLASTAVNSFKPSVEKSGSVSGVGGMLAIQTPYLILTRPRQALPKRQNTYTGYPSFMTSKLSALTGYTEIEEIHLDGLSATESELNEIDALLRNGVIL